jgi:hypothetical protein
MRDNQGLHPPRDRNGLRGAGVITVITGLAPCPCPTALAREVGRRPEVVSRWARRGAELRQTDPVFADTYDGLDAALASEPATPATSELEV